MVKSLYPWIRINGFKWCETITTLWRYKPNLHHYEVRWEKPEQGGIKYNTDGASKGNPNSNSYDFCIWDYKGDLIHTEAEAIGQATNMEAEAKAIVQAARFFGHAEIHKECMENPMGY